jgi:3-methyl-2-oxobutanoate hydroxymethyltransferase
VAGFISKKLNIPTIGIGAGGGCDGQVLVYHDMLGLFDRFTPKFVKKYVDLSTTIHQALNSYKEEVEAHSFPTAEHSYEINEENWQEFLKLVEK